MALVGLEAAAFLYYLSRGMKLELVADFIHRKCGQTHEPRSIDDLKKTYKQAPVSEENIWNFARTNSFILAGIAKSKIKLEKFLETMEFSSADRALLKDNNLLDSIEETKKIQDPLLKFHQSKRKAQSALRHGGMTTMASSFPETPPSLSAPIFKMADDSGAGYSRSTGAARGPSGGYRSYPYSTVGTGPGAFDGSSTNYHGAGADQFSSGPAFQGSAFSNPRSATGHAASPLSLGYSTTDNTGQETSNLQPQYPRTSEQLGLMPTFNKRPATEELKGRDVPRSKQIEDPELTLLKAWNAAYEIEKVEGRDRRKKETQRRLEDKRLARLVVQEERARARKEEADKNRRDKKAQKQAEKDERAKERREKREREENKQQDELQQKLWKRLATHEPYRDDRGPQK